MQIQYPGIMRLCSPNTRFQWSDDLDKELEDLKQCLKDFVKISPINTEKNLEMVIDAAPTVGCSYLLLQKKGEDPSHGYNFIYMDYIHIHQLGYDLSVIDRSESNRKISECEDKHR